MKMERIPTILNQSSLDRNVNDFSDISNIKRNNIIDYMSLVFNECLMLHEEKLKFYKAQNELIIHIKEFKSQKYLQETVFSSIFTSSTNPNMTVKDFFCDFSVFLPSLLSNSLGSLLKKIVLNR
jgi:hypothetical protein